MCVSAISMRDAGSAYLRRVEPTKIIIHSTWCDQCEYCEQQMYFLIDIISRGHFDYFTESQWHVVLLDSAKPLRLGHILDGKVHFVIKVSCL